MVRNGSLMFPKGTKLGFAFKDEETERLRFCLFLFKSLTVEVRFCLLDFNCGRITCQRTDHRWL